MPNSVDKYLKIHCRLEFRSEETVEGKVQMQVRKSSREDDTLANLKVAIVINLR